MELLKLALVSLFFILSVSLVLIGFVGSTNSCPNKLSVATRLVSFVALSAGLYGVWFIYESVKFTTKFQF